ncbi:hypothetical protein [Pontibacillus litoralis]|uniref:Uncharacterized protein n=1 Tax=Pontibacillus litoralis JSM 072002 TaxID=1385512 RepID=A0A0A5G6H6_9BACI|nr:hypothetical protein [Pontibacillus litoralis]KGX86773.1 hypothetical protein N784_03745 [Pontibacillus litoralis JSM 072002]
MYLPFYYDVCYRSSPIFPNVLHMRNHSFPQINTKPLIQSATAFQSLLNDARLVTHTFMQSHTYACQLMNAAQQSKQDEVKQLIKSAGVKHPFDIQYNPDYLHVTFKTEQNKCCKLTMTLQW